MDDKDYMKMAIEIAKLGIGKTSPNPMVGAVIVKNGRIIGQGYHERYGDLHAERNALKNCVEDPKGSTIYVTLEPCCHTGKQPPCVEAIVEAGIARVFVGGRDPNPKVSGKGNSYLRSHGVEVTEDFMRKECDEINEIFLHFIRKKTPYIAMKYAMTLDGKIASVTGKSKWISCEKSREYVHKLRNKYRGILVGIGTVLKDDPLLTCRMEGGRNPVRIICDSKLRIPLNSRIVQSAKEIDTIVATLSTDEDKISRLKDMGVEIMYAKEKDKSIDVDDLLIKLGQRNIDSILVEGGGTINWSFIESGRVNKIYSFISPKILGGKEALSAVTGLGFDSPNLARNYQFISASHIGEDILIESEAICLQE